MTKFLIIILVLITYFLIVADVKLDKIENYLYRIYYYLHATASKEQLSKISDQLERELKDMDKDKD